MAQYGQSLVCVRYRYDAEAGERLKTVEIVVDRTPWRSRTPRDAESIVNVRLEPHEELLRRALLQAGGRWEEATETRKITQKSARALGLLPRILRPRRRKKKSL